MKKIVYLFLVVTFFISCKKEKEEVIEIESEIIIGCMNPNLTQTMIDTTIETYINSSPPFGSSEFELLIDVDNDNINDLSFNHELELSKWGTDKDLTFIDIVNTEFEISSMSKNDTVYYCGFVDSITNPDYPYYDTTFYSPDIGFTCEHNIGISRVSNNNYPQIWYLNDTLNSDVFWVNLQRFKLLYNQSYWGDPMLTEYEYRFEYKIEEGLKPAPEFNYIVFRKSEGNGYRYGWIRISITENSRVYIHEIVFEKKIH
jgi:hypothetical protein